MRIIKGKSEENAMKAITFNFNPVLQNAPFFSMHLIENESCPLHNHTHIEVFYVLKGNGKQIINNEIQHLRQYEIVIMRPNDEHQFIDQENFPCTHKDLLFSQEVFKSACDFISPTVYPSFLHAPKPFSRVLSAEEQAELDATIRQIELLRYSQPKAATQFVKLLCFKLIHYICFSQMQKETYIPEWLDQLIKEIENPANFAIPVPDLLKKYYYSDAYIRKVFKKTTGMTPTEFRLNAQLNAALKMLNETKLSLKEISELCGFHNYTYFYRTFKKKYAMIPKEILATANHPEH